VEVVEDDFRMFFGEGNDIVAIGQFQREALVASDVSDGPRYFGAKLVVSDSRLKELHRVFLLCAVSEKFAAPCCYFFFLLLLLAVLNVRVFLAKSKVVYRRSTFGPTSISLRLVVAAAVSRGAWDAAMRTL
jgi:hypothetical protein